MISCQTYFSSHCCSDTKSSIRMTKKNVNIKMSQHVFPLSLHREAKLTFNYLFVAPSLVRSLFLYGVYFIHALQHHLALLSLSLPSFSLLQYLSMSANVYLLFYAFFGLLFFLYLISFLSIATFISYNSHLTLCIYLISFTPSVTSFTFISLISPFLHL